MSFVHPNLRGRVAIVTGASRGIGKAVALRLAEAGCCVCVAAKSERSRRQLPGTIQETADAIRAGGGEAIAVRTDVRSPEAIEAVIATTVERWGRLDILVNNAGALWWKDVADTPVRRFDMMMQTNARAAFVASHYALPHMIAGGFGHIIMMSPPVNVNVVPHKTGYLMSKFGMTLIAHGLAGEVADQNVACNALWPATLIESQATINFAIGERSQWRKADILADATLAICGFEPRDLTGNAFIDEEVLTMVGVTDFSSYACVRGAEPLRMADLRPEVTHGRGGNPSAKRPT
jgi:citronellol/citronellal dehydrogenase